MPKDRTKGADRQIAKAMGTRPEKEPETTKAQSVVHDAPQVPDTPIVEKAKIPTPQVHIRMSISPSSKIGSAACEHADLINDKAGLKVTTPSKLVADFLKQNDEQLHIMWSEYIEKSKDRAR